MWATSTDHRHGNPWVSVCQTAGCHGLTTAESQGVPVSHSRALLDTPDSASAGRGLGQLRAGERLPAAGVCGFSGGLASP